MKQQFIYNQSWLSLSIERGGYCFAVINTQDKPRFKNSGAGKW
jgi:hypothetical protein